MRSLLLVALLALPGCASHARLSARETTGPRPQAYRSCGMQLSSANMPTAFTPLMIPFSLLAVVSCLANGN